MAQSKAVEVLAVADHQFGMLQVAREGRTTRLYGVALAAGVAAALEVLHDTGASVTLAVPDALPRESVTLLKRLLPTVTAVVAGPEAGRALAPVAQGPRLVVAADRLVRARAVKAGERASPHLAIAVLDARGAAPRFVRAVGPRDSFERLPALVPYFVEPECDGRIAVLGVLPKDALERAKALAIDIETLALDLAVEDPMFVHLDRAGDRNRLKHCRVLRAEERRALVALPAESLNDEVGVHGEHGHFLLLAPSPQLLTPAPAAGSELQRVRLAINRWPTHKLRLDDVTIRPEILRWLLHPCPATATEYQNIVARYSGSASLDAAGPVTSRHIRHADNARVVQALLAELNAIGYCAYTHAFTYGGTTLHNVIADLPGTGSIRVRPELRELVRELLIKHPWPDPPDPWLRTLRKLGGSKWAESSGYAGLGPLELRRLAFQLAAIRDWAPWWFRLCGLAGCGAELVIVGCHLDSTAASTPPPAVYNPVTDPAPGADDDASGIAATLATARYMWQFRNTMPHTVRFCFFNAEEHGRVGSRAYAAHLKAADAPVRAVVCADMIGYNSDANRIFEIHAGYTDAAVRDASVPIATAVASWAATLGALAPAQIYSGTLQSGGTDRSIYDGAINRSDHSSFHEQGYPAVVVSEDFFANLAAEPLRDPNPNYHQNDDTFVDGAYAADITCAIAYAVKQLAGG